VRMPGAAALNAAYVASGFFEAYWEFNVKPVDISAAAIIIREAGGRITDHSGNDWCPGQPNVIASNGLIHENMIEILKSDKDGSR